MPPGWMRLEWRADAASDGHALSFSAPEVDSLPGAESLFTFTDYPTVDVDDPDAVLTVRTSPDAEPHHNSPEGLAIHRRDARRGGRRIQSFPLVRVGVPDVTGPGCRLRIAGNSRRGVAPPG